MDLINSIKKWLEDIGSQDYPTRELDFSKCFDEEYGELRLNNIQYFSLFESQYLVNRLIEGISLKSKIDLTLIHKETQDQEDIFLTDFLVDRYRGTDDYTDDVSTFINSVIELDLIISLLDESEKWEGQLGFNYNIALICLPDLYKISEQLYEFNIRMNT